MHLTLYDGNNYYNRKIEVRDHEDDYVNELGWEEIITIPNVSFIVNDGVRTSQIVNYDSSLPEYSVGTSSPGYAILADSTGEIQSRWWVIESTVLRNGQARLELLRDVIADFKDVIIKSPSFISKGFISSTSNPFIYNPENFHFNQIKQSETALYDKTGMSWLVGYTSRKLEYIEDDPNPGLISVPTQEVTVDYETGKDGYQYNIYENEPFYVYNGITQFRLNFYGKVSLEEALFDRKRSLMFTWDSNGDPASRIDPTTYYGAPYVFGRKDNETEVGLYTTADLSLTENNTLLQNEIRPLVKAVDWNAYTYNAYATSIKTPQAFELFKAEEGKILKDGNRYYKIHVRKNNVTTVCTEVGGTTPLANSIKTVQNAFNNHYGWNISEAKEPIYEIECQCVAYSLWYEDIPVASASFTIPSDRGHLSDAPYDMFCIPVGGLKIGEKYTNASMAWKLAAELIDYLQAGASSNLYDIQYLPYCPIESNHLILDWDEEPELDLTSYAEVNKYVSKLEDGNGELYSAMIWCTRSSFSDYLDKEDYKINVPTEVYDFKVANQVDMYRLVSPNYNGQFEFSATKNRGVQGWNIDCTYKPFSPYIQVSPDFSGLYGRDFNDARGLICGGDFSITQISDAWQQYQLQNKNYENVFKAQISNMDSVRDIQRKQEAWGVAGGAFAAAGQAGTAGLISGNPFIAAGAAVGAGAISAGAGAIDRKYSEKLYNINKNYTETMYELGIENIRALPYALTKVGSQVVNYKIVPFVEYYSATNEEKQNLYNKLMYSGFTVEAVGTIENYIGGGDPVIGSFIQACPIRLESRTVGDDYIPFNEDSHIADFITQELQRGVYFI